MGVSMRFNPIQGGPWDDNSGQGGAKAPALPIRVIYQ